MIQDPQTMEIEEIIPDVMAEMVRMDKDAMEMARAVREEKAAMAILTISAITSGIISSISIVCGS